MLYGKKINAAPRTKTPEQALAALMRLCARVYRELIVHRGSRVKLKQLLKMAKGGAQA